MCRWEDEVGQQGARIELRTQFSALLLIQLALLFLILYLESLRWNNIFVTLNCNVVGLISLTWPWRVFACLSMSYFTIFSLSLPKAELWRTQNFISWFGIDKFARQDKIYVHIKVCANQGMHQKLIKRSGITYVNGVVSILVPLKCLAYFWHSVPQQAISTLCSLHSLLTIYWKLNCSEIKHLYKQFYRIIWYLHLLHGGCFFFSYAVVFNSLICD